MRNRIIHSVLIVWVAISVQYAQSNKFLQIDLSAGGSQPILKYADPHMFAGRGTSFSGGFDYFFKTIGIGFSAGQFSNVSRDLFNSYISKKYLEDITNTGAENWNSKYILAGPTFKIAGKRFEWDVYAKAGLGQINVPELVFSKSFFNQYYQIYQFSGASENYQFAWNGGTRFIYKMNHWLGFHAKAEYLTTSYMSKFNYDYSYRNAQDGNRNGVIEDSEYFEAQKLTHTGAADLNVINVHLGLIFQLGRPAPIKVTKMIPEEIKEVTLPVKEEKVATTIPDNKEEVKPEPNNVMAIEPAATTPKENKEVAIEEIPVINANEAPLEIPATTYEAPEAKYDEEAAEFLHKAGESYFATNDFENALPCFNKLKADPKYPRAKYMFALSLCAMGNCAEAKSEYKDFVKNYKDTDARTLEIIFASHLERCTTAGKMKNVKKSDLSKEDDTRLSSNSPKVINNTTEYRIQFIAMKKPNATFPKLAEVGDISTEFFPNKAVYRYTLMGYKDIKNAASDVYKIRKLGFRDAFIAVYENGQRVNTLYHAK